ncbi:antitoxin HicB [Microbacterium sp. 5K110]|jgi:DNA-directed RNA polymerase sigma subunit (sigma70/sigma32)|uniref:antitoxin HicB n=1 Tax=unclassified Microbacterium TaxID=2609290 RepID=UPI0010FE339C|nr:antitoxin HicB [Microbacterium sp. 5K110]TLF29162.1 antitoxin HicB [Microbacterium sp. 5K110]
MSIQTFDVTVEREGRWWVFDIPRLGTGGQARSLEEVDREAQGVAAMWLDVDPAEVAVRLEVSGAEQLLAEWVAAEHDEAEARRAQARAAERRRAVVTALRTHYTAPDVGRVLGISKQRVYQIEKAKAS